ncbi:MAG: YafY family transcriptional regulator [Proteobacteria bacterium]|nr:YafY family transcriptional regulator [Pseudomonadota bacterium]
MAHPAARVLAVLELLQAHGRMSGTELARRLEVDGRTLRRYITTLEDLGIPITAERGRHGGYQLVTGFKLPPMTFTNDETLAISLGLLAVHSLGLAAAAPAIESTQAKLERVTPANLKRRVRAFSETTTLDLSIGAAAADNTALVALTNAAQARQRVHLAYRAANGQVTARDFDAYGLVYRDGRWYVGGYCHLREDLRSFRLDRVEEVRLLEATFERPADFDAAKHLTFSIATLPRSYAVDILLHTDLANALSELHESLGLFEPFENGVLLRARTDSIDWFARQLSRLSFAFDIREPGELRTAVYRHANRLVQQHRTEGPV